jgi:hypothetical protein
VFFPAQGPQHRLFHAEATKYKHGVWNGNWYKKGYVYWVRRHILHHNKRYLHRWVDVLTSDTATGVDCLLAYLYGAAWVETKFQAGAENQTTSPGLFVVQAMSWLRLTRASTITRKIALSAPTPR